MVRVAFGLFVVLHGLVHLWYVTLSQRLVEFRPEMGWTGRSWLMSDLLGLPPAGSLASVLYVLATGAFVAAGAGIVVSAEWWRPLLMVAAVFSSTVLLLYWDGSMQMLVQKGLLGLLINVAVIILIR